jgi:hypothetical protein
VGWEACKQAGKNGGIVLVTFVLVA